MADADARIYRGEHWPGETVLGCAYAHSRACYVGEQQESGPSAGGGASIERLAGHMAAVEEWGFSKYGTGSQSNVVKVIDLDTCRILHKLPTGTPTAPRGTPAEPVGHVVGNGYVSDLIVSPDGAVAWINDSGPDEYEVHAADHSGERTLATGRGIDPNSLKLRHGLLCWTVGQEQVSVSLQMFDDVR